MLLTRARGETVIRVPRGSRREGAFHDPARDGATREAVADFPLACGARALEDAPTTRVAGATPP